MAANKLAPPSVTASREADDESEAEGDQNPHYNLNVPLQAKGRASGFLRFRQPNDGVKIVYLNVAVRNLAPNAHYRLQRAIDTDLNHVCTGTNWLTLGKGSTPADIVTDEKGRGQAMLFRDLTAIATGTTFDAIGGAVLRGHRIAIPPREEQQGIVEAIESYLSRLAAAVASLERSQARLKWYRASVLAAAPVTTV